METACLGRQAFLLGDLERGMKVGGVGLSSLREVSEGEFFRLVESAALLFRVAGALP